MDVDDLEQRCEEIMAANNGGGLIHLTLPRLPTGEGIRLTPKRGPVGYVKCVNSQGRTVADFGAGAVWRFIQREKLREQRNES